MTVARVWNLAALGWALVVAVVLAFAPLASESSTAEGSGSVSLVQSDGAGVLVPLLVPVVLALVPLVVGLGAGRERAYRVALLVAACLGGAFMLLAILSVGLYYLPTAAALAIAAALAWNAPRAGTEAA